MKRTITATYFDRTISPEILTVEGETEKELIYKYYEDSERVVCVLGEEELIKEIKFETFDGFIEHLNELITGHHFKNW